MTVAFSIWPGSAGVPPTSPAATSTFCALIALITSPGISEKDLIAIDMRQPDRVTMRLTEEAATTRFEQLKSKTKKKGGEA